MILPPVPTTERSKNKAQQFGAPLKGMNTAAPITATPKGYCLHALNMTAFTEGLCSRPGHTVAQTGLGSVGTLMRHPDVATPIALSGVRAWDLMANPGGQWLVSVDGTNPMQVHDGAGWEDVSSDVEDVDTTKLATICWHQSRLWMGSTEDLTAYYLPLDSFQGRAKKLYHHHVCTKGGSIAGIASMTQDGGRNPNDQLLVITTEGEAVLWVGGDPTKPDGWSIGGVWELAKPVGRNCIAKFGGALAYLSVNGLLPIPQVLARPEAEKTVDAISAAIAPTIDPLLASGTWNMAQSIEDGVFVVHGPQGQFIRSDIGSWTRWNMPDASCWITHKGYLWFGTSTGKICKVDGFDDDGAAIPTWLVDRFERFGGPHRKSLSLIRPLYTAPRPYKPRMSALVDFANRPTSYTASYTDSENWFWDDITWARQPMAWLRESTARVGPWRGIGGEGSAFAIQHAANVMAPYALTGWDLQWNEGGTQ